MRALPDVTSDIYADNPLELQWVGMEDISVPISMKMKHSISPHMLAKANVLVSLDTPHSKGIHMSRIHLAINRLAELECTKENINQLLDEMIISQAGISQQAKIELCFSLLLKKPALLSGESGFQAYPITLLAAKSTQGYEYEFEFTIPYSSTCPCSASLSRQLLADKVNQTFPNKMTETALIIGWLQSQTGSVATPHSQRSYAYIRIATIDGAWPDLSTLIFHFEEVIGTPVQTAVKRNDEQEFARLNATNLMFCEDAARRIKQSLESMNFAEDYCFKVEHQESLHAHNAVVRDQKFRDESSKLKY